MFVNKVALNSFSNRRNKNSVRGSNNQVVLYKTRCATQSYHTLQLCYNLMIKTELRAKMQKSSSAEHVSMVTSQILLSGTSYGGELARLGGLTRLGEMVFIPCSYGIFYFRGFWFIRPPVLISSPRLP